MGCFVSQATAGDHTVPGPALADHRTRLPGGLWGQLGAGVSAFSREASIVLLGPAEATSWQGDSASSGPIEKQDPCPAQGVLSPVCSHPLPALKTSVMVQVSVERDLLEKKPVCASHCYTICHFIEKLSYILVPPLFTAAEIIGKPLLSLLLP